MLRKCKHCAAEFDLTNTPSGWMANHTRWCMENPRRSQTSERLQILLQSPEVRAKRAKGIKRAHDNGKYAHVSRKNFQGKKHTDESKAKIRDGALKSKHRRLKKNTVIYKGVLLDSTWELELAKRLDYLNIEWVRPDPLPWLDELGAKHNYFPDFYLPKHDLYLDPKNPHAIKVQNKKLLLLQQQYNNIHIISSLDKCINFTI